MKWKLFDAVTRVLVCGAAVVLLTVLAIPELIDLGLDEERVKELWAPALSMVIVTVLYAILYFETRFRRYGRPKFGEKAVVCAFLSFILAMAVTLSLDLDDTELDWLPTALGTAFLAMGQIAAQEWHILELESGKQAEE